VNYALNSLAHGILAEIVRSEKKTSLQVYALYIVI
jgi:hypothetical protein